MATIHRRAKRAEQRAAMIVKRSYDKIADLFEIAIGAIGHESIPAEMYNHHYDEAFKFFNAMWLNECVRLARVHKVVANPKAFFTNYAPDEKRDRNLA